MSRILQDLINLERGSAITDGADPTVAEFIEGGGGEGAEEKTDPEHSTDPKKGESETAKAGEGQSVYSDGFKAKVEGKSLEEVTEMLHNADKVITKHSITISDLKPGKPSVTTVQTSITKLEKDISKLEAEMDGLDELVDTDKYAKLKSQKDKLESKLSSESGNLHSLEIDEAVDRKFAEDHNDEFGKQMRASYTKDFGLTFTDEAWKSIEDRAKEYIGVGKMTEGAMFHVLSDFLGHEKVMKMISSQGEANFRMKLKEATGKDVTIIGGKHTIAPTPFEELSGTEKGKRIDKMSTEKYREQHKKEFGVYPEDM